MQFKENLSKRAKRKFLNVPYLKHLIDLDSPLKDKYIQSLSCSSLVKNQDGVLSTRYCKRMWCCVCNPIRTAVRLNAYKKPLGELKDLQITTLTCPNVPGDQIGSAIQLFRKIFKQYRNTFKKKYGELFQGVYNFEVTYNSATNLFHPHIHIIHRGIPKIEILSMFPGKDPKYTNGLILYWLHKNKKCSELAQHTIECYNLIEGFKYQSKSFYKIKVDGKNQMFIPAKQLDTMYQELAGLHCFQSFGIAKVFTQDDEDLAMDELTAYTAEDLPEGYYIWKKNDWVMKQYVNPDTGEVVYNVDGKNLLVDVKLTGWIPNEKMNKLIAKLLVNEYYKPPG